MLLNYIEKAMHQAKYEILEEDNSYYGEIPECNGVYANKSNLEDCRKELQEVLEGWILTRIYNKLSLPVIDGEEVKIKEIA